MLRPDFKLMDKEEVKRRLTRMVGEKYVKRPSEITRADVSKWFGLLDDRLVRMHQTGEQEITDFWQIAYSQFFALVDSGYITIKFDERGKKQLVRLAKPIEPPKKKLRPFVDFGTMKLGLDT